MYLYMFKTRQTPFPRIYRNNNETLKKNVVQDNLG